MKNNITRNESSNEFIENNRETKLKYHRINVN